MRGYFDKFFGEIGKTEAYKTVMKLQSYSGYVAFLDTFPKSEKRNDVVNELKAFRIHIVDTNSREWISKQDMINSFGCQDTARLYKWSDEMAGSVRVEGKMWSFGPLAIGNVEILQGSFAGESRNGEEGFLFEKGSRLIYKAPSATKAK